MRNTRKQSKHCCYCDRRIELETLEKTMRLKVVARLLGFLAVVLSHC